METKEFTNDFSQGMTNIPSDSVCQDDSVAAEWNMIYKNSEHCPIQTPVDIDVFTNKSFYIIHIHKTSSVKHYIGVYGGLRLVYIGDDVSEVQEIAYGGYTEDTQIETIGNTMIVNSKSEGIKYFLWKQDSKKYVYLGDKLPTPNVGFSLGHNFSGTTINNFTTLSISSGSYSGIISLYTTSDGKYAFNTTGDKKADADAYIIGLYEKCKKRVNQKKGFCNPFFIRYALKLYDGSYAKISDPILLFPTVKNNLVFYKGDLETTGSGDIATAVVFYCKLFYSNYSTYTDWIDIVKNISVFVTKPVDIVDTGLGIGKYVVQESDFLPNKFDTISKDDILETGSSANKFHECVIDYEHIVNAYYKKQEGDIIKELKSNSVYYKLFDIDPNVITDVSSVDELFSWEELDNLTTLEQLDHDDYFSKCPLGASEMYMYNKRLHLSNVSRGFYEGSRIFTSFNLGVDSFLRADVVHIRTSSGDKVILHQYNSMENPYIYYYYPDARAYKVDRLCRDNQVWKLIETQTLKPHPLLNGAYYLRNTLPTIEDNIEGPLGKEDYTEIDIPKYKNPSFENLPNEIWVSEVNNPFVFNAQGVNTVGNGEILRIISNTSALSQGQFGQFPLFCLTTDGIWTLEVSSTGEYSSAHPISRDICNNPKAVVATDHLIFFSSEKGLMMINGSQVTCVSSMLSGKTFYPTPQENEVMVKYNIGLLPSLIDFLKEAMIAYDYRDNLLWILNPNHKLVYILSIDSGAFGMTTIPDCPVNVINDYPDTIIETKDGETFKTLSLINRPNINDDERRIDGFIFSRPMKFGSFVGLKNLSELRLIERLNEKAGYRLRVFVSDDLKNWTRTNSLRGRGFKYYKLNLIFENMLPTDTVSAIIGRVQTRYQTKFR